MKVLLITSTCYQRTQVTACRGSLDVGRGGAGAAASSSS